MLSVNSFYLDTPFFIQLYTRGAQFLKGNEHEYWSSIDASYMSEESSHESDGEVVMHKHVPTYRSDGKIFSQVFFCLHNYIFPFLQGSTNLLLN